MKLNLGEQVQRSEPLNVLFNALSEAKVQRGRPKGEVLIFSIQ